MRPNHRLFQLVYALAIFLLLLMRCGFGLNSSISGASGCIERERQALLAFKQGVVDESGMLSGWGSEEDRRDCCKWRGVQCSNTTGHVTVVVLHGNPFVEDTVSLRGNLSSSLFELKHLIKLNLSWNWLNGQIPESIGSLKKLKHLDLSFNGLSGPIPSQFRNLTSLEFLDLCTNELSGPISSQLGNLTSLEFLDLSYAPHFDSVKNLEWLSRLSSLKYLGLSRIDLSKADDRLQEVNKLPYLVTLVLFGCNLQDPVAPSIHLINTSSLVVLNLRRNNLTASTFKWLFKFNHNLGQLDLSSNHMQGPIPEALGNMTSLEILSLEENELEGPIAQALGNMTSLEVLRLESNELEGGIPKSFGNLCRLRELHLHQNHLNGMLDEVISNLSSGCLYSSLESLELANNPITGQLPDLISNFSSLKSLILSNNNLSGTLTKSIGFLSNLESLYFSSNNFYGVITEAHFLKLSKLEYLDLSSSHLSINISPDWNPPFQLQYLNLGSCMLGPEFPKWIESQRYLWFLNISHSGISDSIPKWLWNPSSSVREIYLSFNNFSTTLPADLSIHLEGFPGIEMSSNILKGPLPLFPANVTYINLSNNSFSGSIFSLCDITGGFLQFLDLSNNRLSGELPDCLNRWPNLIILNLANNHFCGKILSSIASLPKLESFSLRNNSLVGEVPWSLGNYSSLQFMDLSYNRFSGMIPYWFGEKLPKLTFLLLKSNTFNGSIPLRLCWWTKIQLLDFSNNNLSGSIPWCIHNLTALTIKESSIMDHYLVAYIDEHSSYERNYEDTASIIWKRTGYEFHNIKNLSVFDLSSNRLTGPIPAQIWSLIGLVQLNLSRNQLTGRVPPDMGRMQLLESLDLSRNNLSGQLPQSMSQLDFLGILDLSYNNFSGRIPSGAHIDTFFPSALVGNPTLCGPAINITCPGNENPKSSPREKGNQEDGDSLWTWFKPGLAVGAATGFVGVLAFKLDHPWKYVVFLLFKKSKVWLDNIKDLLYLIIATLAFVVKDNASKLRRKFKSQESPTISS